MRYARGGGLTPKRQAACEQVRLEAAERFARGEKARDVARELRVRERQVEKWRRTWREGGAEAGHLGERGPRWITLNEPWCSAFLGYSAAHHLLVGHGLAVRALRAAGVREAGITLNPDHNLPATGSPADRAAVTRADTQHDLVWTEADTWAS